MNSNKLLIVGKYKRYVYLSACQISLDAQMP